MSDDPDTTVINLAAERERRDGPDPAHTCIVDGVRWFEFCCSYVDANGKTYGFNIWATDMSDALARIEHVRRTAVVDGQLFTTVPL